MLDIITSYLLQTGSCVLPYLGMFTIKKYSAQVDNANHLILPPYNEINFTEDKGLDEGLVTYISRKQHLEKELAAIKLNEFCNRVKNQIDAGESIVFESVGSLQKNEEGKIYFKEDEKFNFLKPITIAAVQTKSESETENQTKIEEDTDLEAISLHAESSTNIRRSYWWLYAAILAALSIGGILYYNSEHSILRSHFANQSRFILDSVTTTYQKIP